MMRFDKGASALILLLASCGGTAETEPDDGAGLSTGGDGTATTGGSASELSDAAGTAPIESTGAQASAGTSGAPSDAADAGPSTGTGAGPTAETGGVSTGATGGVSTAGAGGVSTAGTGGVSTAGTGGVSTAGTGGVSTAGTGGVSTAGTGGVPTGATGGVSTGATGGVSTGATGGVSTGATGGVSTAGTGGEVNCLTCGPTALCSEGCTDPCGCCACEEGASQTIDGDTYECVAGCWDTPLACHYNGQELRVGETAWDTESCNICTCQASGDVTCTDNECSCATGYSEAGHYVSEDPAECATLEYDCPEYTTRFVNDCGCGCQQSPECPATCLCVWGTSPLPDCSECEAIQPECPYMSIWA